MASNPSGQHLGTKPFDETGQGMAPLAQPGRQNPINDDAGAAFDATALPSGAGTWRRSMIIDVRRWRRLDLICKYTAKSGSTAGSAIIIPLFSNENGTVNGQAGPPDKSADVWAPIYVNDGTATAGPLTGTFPATTALTPTSTFAVQKLEALAWKIDPATAALAINAGRVPVDVTGARWVQLLVAEGGDNANTGTLRLFYSLTT